jgi:hypothetical protein
VHFGLLRVTVGAPPRQYLSRSGAANGVELLLSLLRTIRVVQSRSCAAKAVEPMVSLLGMLQVVESLIYPFQFKLTT